MTKTYAIGVVVISSICSMVANGQTCSQSQLEMFKQLGLSTDQIIARCPNGFGAARVEPGSCADKPAQRSLVETTLDRCSQSVISVDTPDGWIKVRNGETKCFWLDRDEWNWTCGELTTGDERSRCAGANYVIASKDPGGAGRRITWRCYKAQRP